MHLLHMIVQVPWKLECFSTSKTRKYLHLDMSVHVCLAVSTGRKVFLTHVTLEWLLAIVDSVHVCLTVSTGRKVLLTHVTLEWLLAIVDSEVFFQLPHRKEGFRTFGTCDVLLTCVSSLVSSQITP